MSYTERSRRRRGAVLVAAALAGAACGGPREALDVGLKEISSDIVLGDQSEPPPPPPVVMPPDAGPIVRPTPLAPLAPPPRQTTTTTTTLVPVPCPSADPLSAPKAEAFNGIAGPPVEATYAYRNDGFFEQGGANAAKGDLPEQSVRVVHDVVVGDDGAFSFAVASTFGDVTTDTGYRVVPETAAAAPLPDDAVATDDFPGLYITHVTSSTPDSEPTTFDPSPDLLLLRLPAEVGTSWETVATDPASGTAITYVGSIGVKQRVDACGEFLDAHVVHVTGEVGPCVNPADTDPLLPAEEVCGTDGATGLQFGDDPQQFRADYAIGTQFGGLILADSVVVDDVSPIDGSGLHRENTAIINSVPALVSP